VQNAEGSITVPFIPRDPIKRDVLPSVESCRLGKEGIVSVLSQTNVLSAEKIFVLMGWGGGTADSYDGDFL